MKFNVEKAEIVSALQSLQRVVANRTTLPILSNVQIEAVKADDGKQGLVLTSTDLDLFMRMRIPAEVMEAGAVTLPARRLCDVVRAVESQSIAFSVNDKFTASIAAGDSSYRIMGLSSEDFPIYPQPKPEQKVVVSQAALSGLLNQVRFAASKDETRYVLNGVLLRLAKDELVAVSTDGRRLAKSVVALPGSELTVDMIVPSRSVDALLSVLQAEGDVEIAPAAGNVEFLLGDVKLHTKLIEGTFPNFNQVIPNECKERVAVKRQELIGAIRRASLMASAKSPSVKMTFGENKLSINANTTEVGEAREDLVLDYKGKELSIGMNPGYLADCLSVLTEDEVALNLIDGLSPMVVKSGAQFLYVVMPLRLT